MLKVLLIDDEPNARRELRTLLSAHPDITISGEAGTVDTARALLHTADYDAVFLGAQLISGTGFDLVADIAPGKHTIFVSAYDHFARRAFEFNALDYLIKPIHPARLSEALRRIRHAIDDEAPEASTPPALTDLFQPDDLVQARTGPGEAQFVRISDLVAITSDDNYAHLALVSGEGLLVRQTLNSWEKRLPRAHFMRVHRTAILNLNFVEGFKHEGSEVSLVRVQYLSEPVRARRHCWLEFTARLTALGRKIEG
jgi:two-component system LytT family response regulator